MIARLGLPWVLVLSVLESQDTIPIANVAGRSRVDSGWTDLVAALGLILIWSAGLESCIRAGKSLLAGMRH